MEDICVSKQRKMRNLQRTVGHKSATNRKDGGSSGWAGELLDRISVIPKKHRRDCSQRTVRRTLALHAADRGSIPESRWIRPQNKVKHRQAEGSTKHHFSKRTLSQRARGELCPLCF